MGNGRIIEGWIVQEGERELAPVRITIENGVITALEETATAPPRWICPCLFNSHTHLGDTVALDLNMPGNLTDLVTPPHGLKHRILASTSRETLVSGMRAALLYMARTGTAGCADFREGGAEGVAMLREAARGASFQPIILGREGGEKVADGLGVSSVRDMPSLDEQVAAVRSEGKILAIHAGERDDLDIEGALAYDPDLLIHVTHATEEHLRTCADRGIPIVVCPRSNWVLGVTRSSDHPPITRMLELGIQVLLGTDNVMFVQPDLFQEMAFLSTVYRVEARTALRAALEGAALFSRSPSFSVGAPARFFTVDASRSLRSFSRDPLSSLVKRGNSAEIEENVLSAEFE